MSVHTFYLAGRLTFDVLTFLRGLYLMTLRIGRNSPLLLSLLLFFLLGLTIDDDTNIKFIFSPTFLIWRSIGELRLEGRL